jgi:hypothetical protein
VRGVTLQGGGEAPPAPPPRPCAAQPACPSRFARELATRLGYAPAYPSRPAQGYAHQSDPPPFPPPPRLQGRRGGVERVPSVRACIPRGRTDRRCWESAGSRARGGSLRFAPLPRFARPHPPPQTGVAGARASQGRGAVRSRAHGGAGRGRLRQPPPHSRRRASPVRRAPLRAHALCSASATTPSSSPRAWDTPRACHAAHLPSPALHCGAARRGSGAARWRSTHPPTAPPRHCLPRTRRATPAPSRAEPTAPARARADFTRHPPPPPSLPPSRQDPPLARFASLRGGLGATPRE